MGWIYTQSKTNMFCFLFRSTRSISPFLFVIILSNLRQSIFSLLLYTGSLLLLLFFYYGLVHFITGFWFTILENIARFYLQVFYRLVFLLWKSKFSLRFFMELACNLKVETDVFLKFLLLESTDW